jgi:hypothetical protein
MSLVEYDLPLKCDVVRCESGLIHLSFNESRAMGIPHLQINCKVCKGKGYLEELKLEDKNERN